MTKYGSFCFPLQSSSEPEETKQESENITGKALKTVNTLATALLVSKVPGEDETKIETKSLAVGVSRENAGAIGMKPISVAGSKVAIPANLSAFSNLNSSLERVVIYLNLIFFTIFTAEIAFATPSPRLHMWLHVLGIPSGLFKSMLHQWVLSLQFLTHPPPLGRRLLLVCTRHYPGKIFAPITFLCLGNECQWWQWIFRTIAYLFLIYCVDYREVPWIPFAFLFGDRGWLESCHFWVVYLKPGDVAIRSNINLLKSQACKFGIFAGKLPMKEERTRKRRSSSLRIHHRSLPHILYCWFKGKHLHKIDKRYI